MLWNYEEYLNGQIEGIKDLKSKGYTARGIHRNDIFRDEANFAMYLILVKELLKYYEKYKITCQGKYLPCT
jgi:hypothetical protein